MYLTPIRFGIEALVLWLFLVAACSFFLFNGARVAISFYLQIFAPFYQCIGIMHEMCNANRTLIPNLPQVKVFKPSVTFANNVFEGNSDIV
uniref:Uncharacterized protein n=1 Tax=Rhizophora mucronata TaxID=61149 RepID=A0A2P2QY62_RHIMU